jgi:Domain of unknown function (DUF6431)
MPVYPGVDRPILLPLGRPLGAKRYSLPVGISCVGGGLCLSSGLGKVTARAEPHGYDSLYLTFGRAEQSRSRLGRDQRRSYPSPVPYLFAGFHRHGRRRKQAHDEHHDWIPIRRGICNLCGKTFTFLPPFSLPYAHYSWIARSQALRRYFVEGCSWEAAAPVVKDANRVADPSTLRRWFRSLDSSRPPFSFLRRTLHTLSRWLSRGEILRHDSLPLCWPTLFPFLHRFWPLRL